MRFFKNLSVGRKLAASAAATILLLIGLVGMVLVQLHRADGQLEAERRAVAARAASRLAALEEDFASAARPDAELLEAALADLEALLDRALLASLPPDTVEAARSEAAAQLKPYRSRMERATYEQTLESLLSKTLRDGRRLPRLSLFHL